MNESLHLHLHFGTTTSSGTRSDNAQQYSMYDGVSVDSIFEAIVFLAENVLAEEGTRESGWTERWKSHIGSHHGLKDVVLTVPATSGGRRRASSPNNKNPSQSYRYLASDENSNDNREQKTRTLLSLNDNCEESRANAKLLLRQFTDGKNQGSSDDGSSSSDALLLSLCEAFFAKAEMSNDDHDDAAHRQVEERVDLMLKLMSISWILVSELHVVSISLAPLSFYGDDLGNVAKVLKGLPIAIVSDSRTDPPPPKHDYLGLLLIAALHECFTSLSDGKASASTSARKPQMTLKGVGISSASQVTAVVGQLLIDQSASTDDSASSLQRESHACADDQNDWTVHDMVVLEANIDDMTAERLAFLCERLLTAGASDAWTTSIGMKKSRPGTMISCLVHHDGQENEEGYSGLLKLLFEHSTTLGVRSRRVDRFALHRKIVTVTTKWQANSSCGRVDVKVGFLNGKVMTAKAEFDHCRDIVLSMAFSDSLTIEDVAVEAVRLALTQM